MEQNRPRARKKHVEGNASGLYRRPSGTSSGGGERSGGSFKMKLIIAIAVLLLGGGGGGGLLSTLLGGASNPYMEQQSVQSHSWTDTSASAKRGELDRTVAEGSRAKRTQILGNGQDQVTIMVYLCGTDLESRSGMATSDLQEMVAAKSSEKMNVIVYTGGCASWKNNVVSSSKNQIYRVKDGGLELLVEDAGNGAMTDPATLTEFIKYANQNYPSNRTNLILWDHGGGSVSGYGYDEKNKNKGSMNLVGIQKALKDAGVTFDFIGFDTCLMATMENALMLDEFADYLIASEETEPGVGWYYTNWMSRYAENTSMPTIEIGQNIVDDFVDVCNQKCRGQKTTLSVVDLAELKHTAPQHMTAFSKSITDLLDKKEFTTISSARNKTREFAVSSKIDQVDLVHLAENMGTTEGKKLAEAVKGAVKYNRTSSSISNAYGLSIYFPGQNRKYVDSAVQTYDVIGMDDEYTDAVRKVASLQTVGQVATGGENSPVSSLLGTGAGGIVTEEMLGQLLTSFLSMSSDRSAFLSDESVDLEAVKAYVAENQFDASQLTWAYNNHEDNRICISMSEDNWKLVNKVDQNLFYDDGEGYLDLGLDNLYDFDEDGKLLPDLDYTWLTIDGQVVAYYHETTVENGEDYTITGRVPALLNGTRVNLILVFDQDHEEGYIAGARYDYHEGETEAVAKAVDELQEGDTLDFICDYYDYEGNYQDTYPLGEQLTYHDGMRIVNGRLDGQKARITYVFTDIYGNEYWTEVLKQ